jgi:hypothetical protein
VTFFLRRFCKRWCEPETRLVRKQIAEDNNMNAKLQSCLRKLFEIVVALGLLTTMALQAESVPRLINYQGKLVDAAGNPLPNGDYELVFRIWDRADSNEPGQRLIWGQTNLVSAIKGLFNVILAGPGGGVIRGTVASNLVSAFTESERYLGIAINRGPLGAVGSPTEMRPRNQILSGPYTLFAERAASAQLADAATRVIESPIPRGLIAMWSGATNGIPQGWALCDGQNGTPDLRGRFVMGISTNRTMGAVGGFESHTHVASITTERPGDRDQAHPYTPNPESSYPLPLPVTKANHLHTVTLQTSEHLPPYYALAFIMKL